MHNACAQRCFMCFPFSKILSGNFLLITAYYARIVAGLCNSSRTIVAPPPPIQWALALSLAWKLFVAGLHIQPNLSWLQGIKSGRGRTGWLVLSGFTAASQSPTSSTIQHWWSIGMFHHSVDRMVVVKSELWLTARCEVRSSNGATRDMQAHTMLQ